MAVLLHLQSLQIWQISVSGCFVCFVICEANYAAVVTFQKCVDYIGASIQCRLVCIMQHHWCSALSQVSHILYWAFCQWIYMTACKQIAALSVHRLYWSYYIFSLAVVQYLEYKVNTLVSSLQFICAVVYCLCAYATQFQGDTVYYTLVQIPCCVFI